MGDVLLATSRVSRNLADEFADGGALDEISAWAALRRSFASSAGSSHGASRWRSLRQVLGTLFAGFGYGTGRADSGRWLSKRKVRETSAPGSQARNTSPVTGSTFAAKAPGPADGEASRETRQACPETVHRQGNAH